MSLLLLQFGSHRCVDSSFGEGLHLGKKVFGTPIWPLVSQPGSKYFSKEKKKAGALGLCSEPDMQTEMVPLIMSRESGLSVHKKVQDQVSTQLA